MKTRHTRQMACYVILKDYQIKVSQEDVRRNHYLLGNWQGVCLFPHIILRAFMILF